MQVSFDFRGIEDYSRYPDLKDFREIDYSECENVGWSISERIAFENANRRVGTVRLVLSAIVLSLISVGIVRLLNFAVKDQNPIPVIVGILGFLWFGFILSIKRNRSLQQVRMSQDYKAYVLTVFDKEEYVHTYRDSYHDKHRDRYYWLYLKSDNGQECRLTCTGKEYDQVKCGYSCRVLFAGDYFNMFIVIAKPDKYEEEGKYVE